MEREKFQIWVMDYLSGAMDKEGKMKFDKFLKDHVGYDQQFHDISLAWSQMDNLETLEPSEKMDERFYKTLRNHIEKQEGTSEPLTNLFQTFLVNLWKPQLAYGLLLLGMGLGIGFYLNSNNTPELIKTILVSDTETEEIREKLILTLLEQPSANKRLQGVSEANKIRKVDEKVIKALLQTLNNDSNVNVRLAAIESLVNYVENPFVREGLVQSIVRQDSPIVQVTLANLMVALQEKKSIEPFKKLIRTKELDKSVKEKIETSIQSII